MSLVRSFFGILIAIIGFSAATTVSVAEAGWKPGALREYRKLERKLSRVKNAEFQAIRSSAKVDISAPVRRMRFRKEEVVDAETFGSGGKDAFYLYSRTGREVSPLVVFFPGVFGNPTSGGSLMVGRQLRRARNHVVVLPNPWGSVFQKARPNFMPGDFEAEAKAMVRMTKAAIEKIGPHRISRVEFLGESYGGFLAPVTAAIADPVRDFRVHSVTSVSVPYHIGNAIRAIDDLADKNERRFFEHGCGSKVKNAFRLVGFAYELLLKRRQSETYAKKTVGCSDAIFAYVGFQQPLYELAKDLNERSGEPRWSDREDERWRRKLRFRDFGSFFFGRDTIDIISRDSATLAYWVSRLERAGIEARALVAKDDPLNPPPGVGVFKVVLSYHDDDLLVLSSGGHLGFRGERRYRRLLRAQFDARKDGGSLPDPENPDGDYDDDSRPSSEPDPDEDDDDGDRDEAGADDADEAVV